jgi:hypothetical protein
MTAPDETAPDGQDLEPTETAPGESRQVLEGFIEPGAPDWVYVPFEVPPGVAELEVSYRYDQPETPEGVPSNRLDIGVFDARGHELGNGAGFRGWSGGARTSFRISAASATPGYLPGPIVAGTWNVVLGPYTIAPDGLSYRIEVAFAHKSQKLKDDFNRTAQQLQETMATISGSGLFHADLG